MAYSAVLTGKLESPAHVKLDTEWAAQVVESLSGVYRSIVSDAGFSSYKWTP